MSFVVSAVGPLGLPIQFAVGNLVRGNEPLVEYQANRHTHRERATTESESEDLVIFFAVVAASKFVERDDVTPQANTNAPPSIASGLNEEVPTPSS
jgi:hypothetical protein